ncbi:MAG: FAD-dependent oxidoreductase [Thermoplasmatales archaeon]|nr:FAD-dependent oxidoreductase [Thermoplasmatales archaeon]MCW6171074.1 FAD-dependent oxidoreductase [Thermoplasmatales archaeon]
MNFIVIGGGAAGMAAASKAKRVDPLIDVTVIEAGPFVSYAECGMPYYLGGMFEDYSKLLHYPLTEFTEKRKIKVVINESVTEIDRSRQQVKTTGGNALSYDYLLISTGASAVKPKGISSKEIRTLRSLSDGITLKQEIEKSKKITIIGDGVLGMELASTLAESGKEITMIAHHEKLFKRLDQQVGQELLKEFEANVKVEKNSELKSVTRNSEGLKVETTVGQHSADLVLSATGIQPNSQLALDAGLSLGKNGAIKVDNGMFTSDSKILAAGDCATTLNKVTNSEDWMPLAQISNKMGRVAGSNVGGERMTFKGGIGTTLVKIFDYEVGFTGIDSSTSIKYGFAPKDIFVKAGSKAAYYEGNLNAYVKITYDSHSGRLLGAQVVSKSNGAWRLNTLAEAIYAGITMEDLFYSDLGYSPPFGPVWDPIIIAASLGMKTSN